MFDLLNMPVKQCSDFRTRFRSIVTYVDIPARDFQQKQLANINCATTREFFPNRRIKLAITQGLRGPPPRIGSLLRVKQHLARAAHPYRRTKAAAEIVSLSMQAITSTTTCLGCIGTSASDGASTACANKLCQFRACHRSKVGRLPSLQRKWRRSSCDPTTEFLT
jgi:hypothetical protein